MKRVDVPELQYITPIANLASILRHGILSHRRAAQLAPHSIANVEVQDRRSRKVVPGGRPLHDYANLYLHARNPMLYVRKERHAELCILRINAALLDHDGVVVSDMNAARDIARFYPSKAGLAALDRDEVFAQDWRHPGDPMAYERHRGVKCAEVLIPDRVEPGLIVGAFVSCREARDSVMELTRSFPVTTSPQFFFL